MTIYICACVRACMCVRACVIWVEESQMINFGFGSGLRKGQTSWSELADWHILKQKTTTYFSDILLIAWHFTYNTFKDIHINKLSRKPGWVLKISPGREAYPADLYSEGHDRMFLSSLWPWYQRTAQKKKRHRGRKTEAKPAVSASCFVLCTSAPVRCRLHCDSIYFYFFIYIQSNKWSRRGGKSWSFIVSSQTQSWKLSLTQTSFMMTECCKVC